MFHCKEKAIREHIAVLFEDYREWILVIDDDESSESVWQDLDTAMKELQEDAWQVVQGPANIHTEFDGLDQFELYGYWLRRGIQ